MTFAEEHRSMAIVAGAAVVGVGLLVVAWLSLRRPKRKGFLEKERKPVTLIQKEDISHDVRRMRFQLPEGNVLGLPIGQHVFISPMTPEGETPTISRPYTPVTLDSEAIGYFDLVLKIYPQGKLTQHLDSLSIGDKVLARGPFGKFHYLGRGRWTLHGEPQPTVKQIGMIAGGTGITPMYQIMKAILTDHSDKTRISLLFGNQTPRDILIKDFLDATGFPVKYTIDRDAPEGWPHFTGFINAEMIKQSLPPPSDDLLILLCGPPPMIERACKPALAQLGYNEKLIVAM